jgi:MFS family permease
MTTHRRSSSLLSGPGARSLLASSLLARLPLAMFSIAILVHARQLTGSFAVAGVASSAYAICGAVSSPALGRLVDRTGQTRVLLAGSAIAAAILICLGLMGRGASPVLLIALAGAGGLAMPPLPACVRALLPAIVSDRSQLPKLFALESTALELTFVFGPPLALVLGAAWSTGGALIVSGGVMVAGTVAFALQPPSRRWRPEPVATGAPRPSGSLTSPAIRALVAITFGMGVVFGATEVGVTATAQHLASAAAAAPVLALWGVGSVIGGLVATRLGGGAGTARGLVTLVAALALTHGALTLGTGSLMVTGAIILLAGATIAPTLSSVYAMVDRTAPAGTQTEAFSWLASAGSTGAAIGAAIGGALAQDAGPAAVFAFGAAAGTVTVAVAAYRSVTIARASLVTPSAMPRSLRFE